MWVNYTLKSQPMQFCHEDEMRSHLAHPGVLVTVLVLFLWQCLEPPMGDLFLVQHLMAQTPRTNKYYWLHSQGSGLIFIHPEPMETHASLPSAFFPSCLPPTTPSPIWDLMISFWLTTAYHFPLPLVKCCFSCTINHLIIMSQIKQS